MRSCVIGLEKIDDDEDDDDDYDELLIMNY